MSAWNMKLLFRHFYINFQNDLNLIAKYKLLNKNHLRGRCKIGPFLGFDSDENAVLLNSTSTMLS